MLDRFALPGAQLFDLLNGMPDWYALIEAGCVRFANSAMVQGLGCGGTCGLCKDDCPALYSAGEDGTVRIGGRVYRRTASCGLEETLVCLQEQAVNGNSELRRQHDRMRDDIQRACTIQAAMLPRQLARVEGYRFQSLYRPCEEMSGDIFDVIRIGRDNIAFYVADVSGHGVTAAMLTVFFSAMVKSEMHPTDMPGDVLARVQKRFCELELDDQHYITAFLARLELSTGNLYWSNAGHICPPVLHQGGEAQTLEMPGLPVCSWFGGCRYTTQEGTMDPGGRILLYSDGLEASWHHRGGGDLSDAVGDILGRGEDDTLQAVWQAACAPPYEDDITLLLIERMAARPQNGG